MALEPNELTGLERAAALEAALASLPEIEQRAVLRLSAKLQEAYKIRTPRAGRGGIGPVMGLEIMAAVGADLDKRMVE